MTNAEIITAYNEGKTSGQLALMTGKSRNAIVGILNRAAAKGYEVRAGKRLSEDDVFKALRMRDMAWPVKDIAKLLGVSRHHMADVFKECDHD